MEKAFKYMCIIMSAIIILSSVSMVFAANSNDLAKVDILNCNEIVSNINNYEMNMTSIIYVQDKEGKWVEYKRIHGTENRIWVDIENIPQKLIDAFISIEDQRFYTHSGVDWKRTLGAFVNYLPFVSIYSSNQGGSTITQQLIKNITSDKGKTALRKVREIARALLIEDISDKTTILEAYLNTISLGSGICGVQVAANYYFNKDVNDLSLAECASLAAITKNPSAYNPETKPKGNKKRRDDVLYQMYLRDKITAEEYVNALKSEIVLDTTQKQNFEIPVNNYFVDALIEEIVEDFSVKYNCSTDTASTMLYNGGYKIYATVDANIQEIMESVYQNQVYFPQKSSKDKTVSVQSAMTILDYEGNIKGIVGGVGQKTVNRGLNRAIDSPRQPGSTMKPLGVYVQAIENNLATSSTIIEDKPLDYYYEDGTAGPREWYGYYDGYLTVAKALERSANTIPCWILRDSIGIENSFNFLTQKLRLSHLTNVDKNVSSLALGGCQYGITTTQSAAAFAIFGNGGKYYEPTTYKKVLDINDRVVLEADNISEQVIKDTTATIMNRLLQNVVYGGSGTGGRIAGYNRMRAYAKTGTSSEAKDLWMVAGTPYYVGSVWYGFDQPENVYLTSGAGTVWRDIMAKIHKDLEHKEFTYSQNVIAMTHCADSGLLPSATCTNTAVGYYVSGHTPGYCTGVHPVPTYVDPNKPEEPTDPTTEETPSGETPPSDGETGETPPVDTPPSDGETPPSETPPSDDETGDTPPSETPPSDEVTGDTPPDETPPSDDETGDTPPGDDEEGNTPSGDNETGDTSSEKTPSDESTPDKDTHSTPSSDST